MDTGAVIKRVRRLADTRDTADPAVATLRCSLNDVTAIRAWVDASEAALINKLRESDPFPEASIAAAARCSVGAAGKTAERSDTLVDAPTFATALDHGAITSGHVDELTRASKKLDAKQRNELFEQSSDLAHDAGRDTIEQFRRRLGRVVNSIQRSDGEERLERQRKATALSTWVDDEGMWNLRARFDPVTGLSLSRRLDDAVATLFAETEPDNCPSDPIEKQKHLRALALARMMHGGVADVPGRSGGKPEFIAVIDVDQPNGAGGAEVDWGLPVEVPVSVLATLLGDADVHAVVVRNGVVLHAPGRLNLGRTARHANRAQRRALRGLYSTCAIPGCSVHFDRSKLHHVVFWSRGGLTDLDNLLPLCVKHHHRVHDDGWALTLGANRELTIRFPNGTVQNTGPPSRLAA